MMFDKRIFPTLIFSLILLPAVLWSQVRLKEIARLQGLEYRQLVGYGLVIGLNGSGDSKRSEFTMQSVVNMLQRFGITVPREKVKSRNVAAVMVTGEVPAFARKGDRVDITISSIGDAKSLEGGVLLLTPLSTEDGMVVAMAQGPLTVGGFSVETSGGGGVRQNHTLVGRIPQGASLQKDLGGDFQIGNSLTLSLKEKDLTTTYRVIGALNQHFNQSVARAINPYTIEIDVPPSFSRDVYRFLAEVEQVEITPDEVARVVINERTGTIVIGGHVTIGPAAIAHGNLSVEIRSEPIVSQPAPFSQGQTTVVPNTSATVYQDQGQVVTIDNVVTVQEIAQALNTIGLMPRDIIAVLQALKTAGALRAELVIM